MPMTSSTHQRRLRDVLGSCLLGTGLWMLAPFSQAQNCWVSGSLGMNFGSVSAVNHTDAQTSLTFTCGSNSTPAYVRMCLTIGAGSPIPDIYPRRMTNYNNASLQYNLYADAMRTQVIGPQGSSPEYTWTMSIPGNGSYAQANVSMPVYGRVFAGQGTLPSGQYQSQLPDVQLRYAIGSGSAPPNCSSGTTYNIGSSGILANMPSGCRITAVSDMDFGTLASSLSSPRDQSASLTLRCPSGTQWQVDMGQGNHYSATRRMGNGVGDTISYRLYRDAARTQLWGSTSGGGTLAGTGTGSAVLVPIYGRLPAQGSVATGSYTDTVVVTLTY